MFSSIPGVYPLDASNTPSVVTTKMALHIATYKQGVGRGKIASTCELPLQADDGSLKAGGVRKRTRVWK